MHLLINGGGLVGCFTALLMLKHFPIITVVEKRFDLRQSSIESMGHRSINLVLTSRGLFALRQVGLEKEALAIAVSVEGRIMHSNKRDAKHVFQPYGVNQQEVNYSISRTALNQLLINEAEKRGVRFIFNHELLNLKIHKDGGVTIHCEGTDHNNKGRLIKLEADVCFGTDGVASPTRTCLLKHLNNNGVASAHCNIERLGISYKELTFPTTKNGEYSMNSKGLHIWPRGAHFLMALADIKNTFTGTLYLPDGSAPLNDIPNVDDVPSFESLNNDRERLQKYITDTYPDVPGLVPDYIEQLTTRPHSFLATIRCTHWHYKGSVLILGDASHGVVPFFGQGMNLGFESAIVLDRFLSQVQKVDLYHRNTTIAKAFSEFQAYHHPCADAIADMAIENFTEMSCKVGQRDFLLRKAVENTCEKVAPKYLRSRYYMVTKTLIPYNLIKKAGPHIDACITEIIENLKNNGITSNYEKITQNIVIAASKKHLIPFLERNQLEIIDPLVEYYPPMGLLRCSNNTNKSKI